MITLRNSAPARPALRLARQVLLGMAILATLIGLFYTVENWRGKRAWQQYKREAEAKGIDMDWAHYIPPPVPDDQNFFAAPNMQLSMTGRDYRKVTPTISVGLGIGGFLDYLREKHLLPTAEITVVPAIDPSVHDDADLVLQYHEHILSVASEVAVAESEPASAKFKLSSEAKKQIEQWVKTKNAAVIQEPSEPNLIEVFSGSLPIAVRPRVPVTPLRIVIRSDQPLTTNQIGQIFATSSRNPQVTQKGPGSFRVAMDYRLNFEDGKPAFYFPAADFIAWSDGFQGDWAAIHKALLRPYARMEGDYQQSYAMPVQNFVVVRFMAEMLMDRIQCYLLLNEPEKALGEMTFLRDLSRCLESRPTGKPMTLVAAIINVNITDWYIYTFAEGLRLSVWREQDLSVLEQQMAAIDLPPYVHDALICEAVGFGHIVETFGPDKIGKIFSVNGSAISTFWRQLKDCGWPLFFRLAPRGWLYQNAINLNRAEIRACCGFDLSHQILSPKIFDQQAAQLDELGRHISPYNCIARIAVPNTQRATMKLGRVQTFANEGMLACALERYRLANGKYPDSLETLVPKFAEKIPTDIIGGGPLKYRNEGDHFVLYSIGWNEKDDGGTRVTSRSGTEDLATGDWVWPPAN
jgi:hypothetical protein